MLDGWRETPQYPMYDKVVFVPPDRTWHIMVFKTKADDNRGEWEWQAVRTLFSSKYHDQNGQQAWLDQFDFASTPEAAMANASEWLAKRLDQLKGVDK